MTGQKKTPAPMAVGGEGSEKTFSNAHSSRCPTFPPDENHGTHCRAVLGCLLTGGKVDQFSYHQTTGYPLVDFRTRISNLRLAHHWPIEDEFHETRDFNGEPRRVKRYWLDRDAMQALFKRQPEFKHRCMLFSESFKQGGRDNG